MLLTDEMSMIQEVNSKIPILHLLSETGLSRLEVSILFLKTLEYHLRWVLQFTKGPYGLR